MLDQLFLLHEHCAKNSMQNSKSPQTGAHWHWST